MDVAAVAIPAQQRPDSKAMTQVVNPNMPTGYRVSDPGPDEQRSERLGDRGVRDPGPARGDEEALLRRVRAEPIADLAVLRKCRHGAGVQQHLS